MVTETEKATVNEDESVLPLPDESDAGAIVAPAEEIDGGEQQATDSETTPRKSWDERRAEIEADEEHATAYKGELDGAYLQGVEAERVRNPEYQQNIQSSREVQGHLRKANTVGEGLTAAIENLVATGDTDLIQGVADVLGRDPKVADSIRLLAGAKTATGLVAFFDSPVADGGPTTGQRLASLGIGQLNDKGHYQGNIAALPEMVQGNYYAITRGLIEGMAKEVGAPSILRDFDSYNGTVLDASMAAIKSFAEQAKKQGVGLGNKRDAELQKGADRGVGPDTSSKGSSGGSYTYSQILKMSPKQLEALPDGALQAAIDKT